MKSYGLIGYPLGHSFSQTYFQKKFEKENITGSVYKNYPIEKIEFLPRLIAENPELIGLNVTIPYKEEVIKYLSDIDPQAKEIEAVNCIRIYRNGDNYTMKGYNTDCEGFRHSLLNMIGECRPNALIFGTGGASKAVAFALRELRIDYKIVSRNSGVDVLSYKDITETILKERKLLINCTPVGTYPNVNAYVDIPYDAIDNTYYLYDLVYNPSETEFLRKGRVRGAAVKNGYEMLVIQAELGYKIFS